MAVIEANAGGVKDAVVNREPSQSASTVSAKNVLFATDFSETSEAALPYATAICRRFGATLHTAHVISDASLMLMTGGVDYVSMGTIYEDAQSEAKEKLEELSARFEGTPHRGYVRHGSIWKKLAEIIEENAVDLIVVGTHGRTGLGKLLLGSVAENILRHANCPVLTVGPKVSGHAKLPDYQSQEQVAPLDLELRQIIFATNFARHGERAAREAIALAGEFRARLTAMHVMEDYTQLGSRPGPIEESVEKLQRLLADGGALQYVPETVVEFGSAPERILKVASDRQADLIVLGARSSAEVGTHLSWSNAHHVIAKAHCPVLTIRQ